jgi:hypothetical protein
VLAQVFVPTWWSIRITAVSLMLKVIMLGLLWLEWAFSIATTWTVEAT